MRETRRVRLRKSWQQFTCGLTGHLPHVDFYARRAIPCCGRCGKLL